jgi:hypothetical protein
MAPILAQEFSDRAAKASSGRLVPGGGGSGSRSPSERWRSHCRRAFRSGSLLIRHPTEDTMRLVIHLAVPLATLDLLSSIPAAGQSTPPPKLFPTAAQSTYAEWE